MSPSPWAECLPGRPLIGRSGRGDNCFELGGHSLLATQLITRLRQAFNVDVPLVKLFEAPTISTLAIALRSEASAAVGAGAPQQGVPAGTALTETLPPTPPAAPAQPEAALDGDLEDFLREIESMSDDEVERQLARHDGGHDREEARDVDA